MRTKLKPRWRYAARSVANRCAGAHSAVCATNEAFVTPSATWIGLSGGSQLPRGCVFVENPCGVVADAHDDEHGEIGTVQPDARRDWQRAAVDAVESVRLEVVRKAARAADARH